MANTPLELLEFPVRCGYPDCGAHITEEHLPEAIWEFATSNMEEVNGG